MEPFEISDDYAKAHGKYRIAADSLIDRLLDPYGWAVRRAFKDEDNARQLCTTKTN